MFNYFKLTDVLAGFTVSTALETSLIAKLIAERNHTSVLSEDLTNAKVYFRSVFERVLSKYETIYNTHNSKLTDLLDFTNETARTLDTTELSTNNEDAASDSSLTKENDTPTPPDVALTGDSFISHATRTDLEQGARASERNSQIDVLENVTATDFNQALEQIAKLESTIIDIEGAIIRELDRQVLVYNFDS